ncbi:MAG: histidine phosphatase family protein [Methanoregulaceae archaeon]|nr:histidine phosphatase family protein [Methanoregulaceae archaeon]
MKADPPDKRQPDSERPKAGPGGFVLEHLREVPTHGRTILFLRHSKRDSFQGVPDHLRPHVEITPDGIRMAREFGESLRHFVPGRRLFLAHTPARRCRMTAEHIGRGYSPEGHFRIVDYQEEIGDPIVDVDRYIGLRDEFGWQELILRWLEGEIPGPVMQDPCRYSDKLLKHLVSFDGMDDGDLFVVIGHDITIFPILSSLFGKKLTSIEFLNGVVISADTATAEVRYADPVHSLRTTLKVG